jgi:hypothetical protein
MPQVVQRDVAVGEPCGVIVGRDDRVLHELPLDRLLERVEVTPRH